MVAMKGKRKHKKATKKKTQQKAKHDINKTQQKYQGPVAQK